MLIIVAFISLAFISIITTVIFHKREKKCTHNEQNFDYSALINFLEKADDAYILTHATLNIMYFSKFACSRACNDLIEFLYRNPPKMFGSRKTRQREWYIVEQLDHAITLRKSITHRQVKVKRGIKIKLGDDMTEYWEISIRPAGYQVKSIYSELGKR